MILYHRRSKHLTVGGATHCEGWDASWGSAEHAKLGCSPLGKLDSDIEFWTINLK